VKKQFPYSFEIGTKRKRGINFKLQQPLTKRNKKA
jgi:hypothetical protein